MKFAMNASSLGMILLALLIVGPNPVNSFSIQPRTDALQRAGMSMRTISSLTPIVAPATTIVLRMANEDDGVVELGDTSTATTAESNDAPAVQTAPFLSQGEISEDALNPDLSDPKQTRVIIYIILSLIPVLFLIPLMLGSRDLIPVEMLPPVDL